MNTAKPLNRKEFYRFLCFFFSLSKSILTDGELVSSYCPDRTDQMKAIRKTAATEVLITIKMTRADISSYSIVLKYSTIFRA